MRIHLLSRASTPPATSAFARKCTHPGRRKSRSLPGCSGSPRPHGGAFLSARYLQRDILVEERTDFVFVRGAQTLRGDSDLIALPVSSLCGSTHVLVSTLLRERIDLALPLALGVDRDAPVQNAEGRKLVGGDSLSRVVRETLVATAKVSALLPRGAHGISS